jgi:outer membrane protein W
MPHSAAAEGLYGKALGGLSLLQDDAARRGSAPRTDANYDSGISTGAAVGYTLTPNFAAELEFMYRTADLGSFGSPGLGTAGDYASAIVSAHVIYTFDGWYTGATGTCRPFVGIGLGVVEEVDFDVKGGTAPQEYEASGDLVWQVRAGADWAFAKEWSLTAEVRYLDMNTPDLKAKSGGANLKAGYSAVDLLVGLAYRF